MKESRSGNLELKPFQLHELEKQKNTKYNWNQPGQKNPYSKFQNSCQQRVKYSPDVERRNPIVQKPLVQQPKVSRQQIENYYKQAEVKNEAQRGKKHQSCNTSIENSPIPQENNQTNFEFAPIKPSTGSKSIYEQQRGLKIFNKKQQNPIIQENVKPIIKAPRYPAEPSKEMTRKYEKAFFLGGGEQPERTRNQSPTFNSSVFNLGNKEVEESAPKPCFKNTEKRADSLGGIMAYDSGPKFNTKEISKPVDAAPNQISKECRQIWQEKMENKNYSGFKDRMLNHQWNLG